MSQLTVASITTTSSRVCTEWVLVWFVLRWPGCTSLFSLVLSFSHPAGEFSLLQTSAEADLGRQCTNEAPMFTVQPNWVKSELSAFFTLPYLPPASLYFPAKYASNYDVSVQLNRLTTEHPERPYNCALCLWVFLCLPPHWSPQTFPEYK